MYGEYIGCPYCGGGKWVDFKREDITKKESNLHGIPVVCAYCKEEFAVRFTFTSHVKPNPDVLIGRLNKDLADSLVSVMNEYVGKTIKTDKRTFYGNYYSVHMGDKIVERVVDTDYYIQLDAYREYTQSTVGIRAYITYGSKVRIRIVDRYELYTGYVREEEGDTPTDILRKYIQKYLINSESY